MIKRNYNDLEKNLKDYKKYTNLLGSDIASLRVEVESENYSINFGEDGIYKIYTTKDYTESEIPSSINFIEFRAGTIEVYKAGFSVLVNLKSV